ncbi:DUF1129 family protein [Saccharibacillus alkalitolerans]|uniref:DUF1129 domain-containing protein n=1 Tax=Saccharibacillus alkalitolerans TaxID=2705290 RepID=A0ABX0F738_9BACL|nr:DUF1129 family protein [Saccharibacillus alkalitolerans]NGZ75344.1 DUF1129 domain-containing protein [Saccharibacillus alkalitolerans]
MSVRKTIREINGIRDQLSKKNAEYFDEVIVHVRSSRVTEESGEDWLLARGRELLAAQQKGGTAAKLFGQDPVAFADGALAGLPQRRAENRSRLWLLAPWAALSWTFLLLGLTALFAPETENVNIGLLLIVVVGALVLVEVLMRLVRRDPGEGVPAPPKFNARNVGTMLAVLVAVGIAGLLLIRIMPVVTIPYWLSLALAAAGFVGQFALLRRR